MLKALLKKQFMELNSFYFQDRKTGKRRSRGKMISYILLYAVIFVGLGAAFYAMASMFASALLPIGLGWVYFAFMGIMTIFLGVFGGVFNTYASLYQAKDNELLLSMPISSGKILLVRMIGVYAMCLLYEALVFIPTLLAYFIKGSPTPLAVVQGILLLVVLNLLITTLSCALGWVVALISGKLKNKSFITVIISLAFFGVYYYFCFNYYATIQKILMNIDQVSVTIHDTAYPLYLMGRAGVGDPVSMLIFTLGVVILMGITYWILTKTFLKIATKKTAGAKAVYREKTVKAASVQNALFRKELRRFTSSANYMLNCALGTVMMPITAVALVIFRERVLMVINLIELTQDLLAILGVTSVCMMATMNDLTAPSISLEGKTLWILQTLPVDPTAVFDAKQYLQWVMTIPPVVLLTTCYGIVTGLDLATVIIMNVFTVLFVMLNSAVGLVVNLKRPSLTWTNETAPIKQSLGVMVCLFGGWLLSILYGLVGYFAQKVLSGYYVLLIGVVILAVLTRLANLWLKKHGTVILQTLS